MRRTALLKEHSSCRWRNSPLKPLTRSLTAAEAEQPEHDKDASKNRECNAALGATHDQRARKPADDHHRADDYAEYSAHGGIMANDCSNCNASDPAFYAAARVKPTDC